MKPLFLILALLFAQASIAVAPYGFKGQYQTATQYSNVLQFPNRSVVKTGGINSLVDTSENLLYNGSIESATLLDGWTCTNSGGFTAETSEPLDGNKSLKVQPLTVGGHTCYQDFNINQNQRGQSLLLSAMVRASGNDTLQICYRENGAVTSICSQDVSNGIPTTEAVIGSSATSIGYQFTIPYNSLGLVVRMDKFDMRYGTAVTNQPVLEVQTSRRDFGASASPVTVTGALNVSSGQGIYSYNSGTGTYTVLKDAVVSITAATSASITQTSISINISGQISHRDSSNYDASTSAFNGRLTAGQTFSVTLTGGGSSAGVTVSVVAFHTGVAPVYTGRCNDPRNCETVFSAKVSSTGVVSGENLDWINGNCNNPGTGLFNCPFSTSLFSAAPNCFAIGTYSASQDGNLTIDTTTTTNSGNIRGYQSNTPAPISFNIICQRQGQDYINAKVNQIVGSFKDYVKTPNTTTGKVGFCSAKISATGVISDHLGGCFASCTNATTPVCTFTSNYWKSGSVPNCWTSISPAAGYAPSNVDVTTTTMSGLMVNTSWGTQGGARTYICHGEIQ